MALKKITYGDLSQLLESEGFKRDSVDSTHELFEKPGTRAALVLPVHSSTTQAARLHLSMVRKTLIDFGVMTSAEFQRWVADPKRYQAA